MLLREEVFKQIENSPGFPMLPEDTKKLLELLHDNSALEMQEVIELIEKNESLSKRLLSGVNSPMFGPNYYVETIKDAVVLLGYESVRNVAVQDMILNFFPAQKLPGQHFDIAVFWRHLVAVALLADEIGKIVAFEDEFRLFTYGLLHDIGTVIIDACLPDEMDEIEEKMLNGIHHLMAEKLVLGGLDHTDVGAWICEKWGLGESISRIVAFHHTPTLSSVVSDDLRIIYLSEIIGERYYEKLLGLTMPVIPYNVSILEDLSITENKLILLEDVLMNKVDAFIQPYL